MADKLRKFRKDDYVDKRFGKDINVSTKEDAPLKKDMSAAETKSVEKAKPASGADKPSSFAAAFRAARKAAIDAGRDPDKEIFTWGGQKKVAKLATSGNKSTSAPTRRSPPAPAPKQVDKPSIPAAAKSVADKAAGYRAAFQRQDGQTGFSKPKTPAPKAPTQDPNWGRNIIAKRDAESAAKRRFLPNGRINPAAIKPDGSIDMTYKAKGGSVRSVDGIAKRGKTRAPMKRK